MDMRLDLIREVEQEIERLLRRHAAFARELPEARLVPARWTLAAHGICWHVPLEEVDEPDIDVEIAREVLIVRARRTWPDRVLFIGILPVPRGYDLEHPVIRYLEDTLEIRLRPRSEGGR